ncbi:MAG: hypothetical protein KDD89_11695, partial [Anaerolineales bacterium]|nr:hypothetical protein [Anaerolineales bacterium]
MSESLKADQSLTSCPFPMLSTSNPQTMPTAAISPKHFLFRFGLASITITLFWQIWFDIAGLTVRSEDVIAFLLICGFLLPVLLTRKLRYKPHILNLPLVLYL